MTGTAKTEEKEFQQIYGMDVIQIPTNKPIARKDLPDRVYDTIDHKYTAVAKKAKELHEKGQPILIGTTSIRQSEKVAEYLEKAGLKAEVLNAKTVEQEVQLISLAGQKGRITVATNMAGRGTDIMLGDGVAELGGLYVIGTERHESRRIDNQLKGRSGRQGDPGCTEFFISMEDDLVRRYAHQELEKIVKKLKTDSDGRVLNDNINEFFNRTQRICEGANFSIREYNIKLDDVLNLQRGTIYDLRTRILESRDLYELVKSSLESFVKSEIDFVCNEEEIPEKWNLPLLVQHLSEVIPHADLSGITEMSEKLRIAENVNEQLSEYLVRLDQYQDNPDFLGAMQRYLLSVLDHHWLNHLDNMERLKEGIGLRSYSQEDPMRQYSREGLELFTDMFYMLERDVSRQTAAIIQSLSGQ
jgi:preprotein translocase subunit SecA